VIPDVQIEGHWGWVILDIVFVYYIFYRVLLLIKGTRAAEMLVGVALLIIAFLMSRRFHLNTSNWLLENFTSSFILFLIVIFQADIRRGLVRVGRRRSIFGLFSPPAAGPYLDEVVRSAEQLSHRGIGGLLVLERDADLSDYLEEGTPIDARVTEELIFSILVPSSPIHDGAIIIQKGRIAAAGCFLPLTQNPRISRFLGTRHRAAIGVTEETDAVVIVISEETGRISLGFGGELKGDLDPVTLRNELIVLFGRSARPKGRLFSSRRAGDRA
jgi:uncharacterized protein (TIGR00159 family)